MAGLYQEAWSACRGRVDDRLIADQAAGPEEVSAWLGGGFEVYRALVEGRLVGAVRCSFPTGACFVDRLAVHPEHRSRGFGRVLLEHAVSRARRAGVTRVWAHVPPGLEDAMALYASLGFRSATQHPASAWGEDLVALELLI